MNPIHELLLMPKWILDELRRLELSLHELLEDMPDTLKALEEATYDQGEFDDAVLDFLYCTFALN